MIHATGKVPSPLPKSLNQSTGKYSTQATGFNDASLGENTCSLVKLITHKLRPKSYNKIVEGTRAFAKKTCGVIDLTADEPPTEFAMIVDLPTDNEGNNKGGNVSDDGNSSDDGNAGDDGNEGSDGEEDEDGNDRGGSENEDEDEDMMEGEYEEEDAAIYVDDEDK